MNANSQIISKLFIFNFYLLALSLAPSEFLKQVSTIFLMILGLYYIFTKKIEFSKDIIFYSAVAFVITSIISAILAINSYEGFKGAYDVFRIMFLFLIFRDIKLEKEDINIFLNILYIATILTLFYGLYQYFTHQKIHLELKSIGYYNHSAIFLLIVFILSLTFFLKEYEKLNITKKIFLILVSILTFIGIFIGGSRAAMGTSIIMILFIFFLTGKINKRFIFYFIAFFIIAIAVALINNYTLSRIHQGLDDNGRIILWISSIKGWLEHDILFGIGPNNAHYINPQIYFPNTYFTQITHSHNTFLTFLLEKGIFGLLFYTIFIIAIFLKLIKNLKLNSNALTISALAIWLMNLIISFVNTTFHHENGLLMALIWAIALNKNIQSQFNEK